MWGGFFCRYAAMAPVRTSGYVPLLSAFTSYSAWLWLNCFTSSFVAAPSWPPIACQNWISVLACAGAPTTSRAALATMPVQRALGTRMVSLLSWTLDPPGRRSPTPRAQTIAWASDTDAASALLVLAQRDAAHEAPLEQDEDHERGDHRGDHAGHDHVPLGLRVGRHEHLDADLDHPHVVRRRDDERPEILVPHVQELHEEQRRQVVQRERQQHAEEEAQRSGAVDPRRFRQAGRDRQEELPEQERAGRTGEEGHRESLVGVHPAEVVHELKGWDDSHGQRQHVRDHDQDEDSRPSGERTEVGERERREHR